MKRILPVLLAVLLLASGCSGGNTDVEFKQIDQETAKEMMDSGEAEVILDVREQSEYSAGHIPGAVLLPLGEIDEQSASQVIPDKDTVVLVYCRSGRRSVSASQKLSQLGYSNIYEFGGIIDWSYDIVK